jgi:hypothetical protein
MPMPEFPSDFEWQIDTAGYRLERLPRPWKDMPLGMLAAVVYDHPSAKPMWVVRRNGGKLRSYRPLAVDTLYKIFRRIETPEEVLDFIQKFGSLTQYGAMPDRGDPVLHVLEDAQRFRDWLNGNNNAKGGYFTHLEASLVTDVSGALRLRVMPNDLMSALWLQLALNLSKANLRTCLHCGEPFEVGVGTSRRADAKFCLDKHRVEFNSRKRSTPLAIRRRP